jgi:NagD protein
MTSSRAPAECWLIDMDGVLVHEGHALPGAGDFLARLTQRERRFLVLTNNSIFTPRDLAARLVRAGLQAPEASISGPPPWRRRTSCRHSCRADPPS